MAQDYMYKGSIETVDNDERTVLIVRKHMFGILQLYIASGIGLGFALILLAFLLPSVEIPGSVLALITGVALFVVGFAVIILLIATYIYFENKIIITNKNITQVLQRGLFSRKISQLSMANVEDVTSDQHGFFATFFNYGILKIETAGEQANFHFTYTPNCGEVAKQVLEARERFIEYDPELAARANQKLHLAGSGKGGQMYNTPEQNPGYQPPAQTPQA